MSLLLDALKRAEEAKRAKLSAESGPDKPEPAAITRATPSTESTPVPSGDSQVAMSTEPPEFRLEDYKEVIAPKASIRAPLAGKSIEVDPQWDADLHLAEFPDSAAVASAKEKSPLPASTLPTAVQTKLDSALIDAAQSRDTARNVFVAKRGTKPEEASQKKWLIPVIAAMFLAVGGGGWYVWNEINRMSRPANASIAARPVTTTVLLPSPPPSLPPAQPATGQPGAPQQAEISPKAVTPVELPLPPLLPPPAEQVPLPRLTVRAPPPTGPPLTEREALARSLREAPVAKEPPVGLKLARSIEAPAVNADLLDAYGALRNADYPRARALYARLVLADPLNADVQLGMATAFARSGDAASAARHYRQVLVIDPRNGMALAGLLAVSDTKSPSLEGELRALVSRNPETSSLRFTLGNLYASERRWVEAQQAYFEAYRLESDNADYMYNLAVSLDQLKQPKLALDYYQKALSARIKVGGQFDQAAVSRRIKDLATETRIN